MGLQIFLYQRLAGLMILGEEERLLINWMEKICERRELNKGLGRRKEQCPFSSLSLGWFAFFALTLFPQQDAWSQIQKFLQLHPWEREVEKRRAFSKEKPQKTQFVKLICILVKKRIYSNLVVTIIFTFASFLSKVSILLSANSLICWGFMSGQVIRALSILKRPLCY